MKNVKCDLEKMNLLAKDIASRLSIGNILCLKGDLGAGKTTFAKMVINALEKGEIEVTSPTFNIVNVYNLSNSVALWHFDLYRLKEIGEVDQLGIEDAFSSGISIIEWPEIIENSLPKHTMFVSIDFAAEDGDVRLISVRFGSESIKK
ncbi:tRNA (adenosine(37)-N6)-threonylcarbamoyltransferase complex ATPase subunit type 1 TsaE [Candidatus Lariskella endosymbiont of Epinotia ramella]|uniref:tRNA (adenosine(37)-N6)-threonylcarbamoyltransferase complex ATPase subunit type 1 TsaE n=1 Tax=Candidatus Lariskella endosymbiont of Epinotia ramella TaxID=3066224 RepID=UPI0030D50FA0